MDSARLASLIADLYNVVDGLDDLFADCRRRFTPDGHLVGSIGEAISKYVYELIRENGSKAGWDATFQQTGQTIQIKTTSVTSISVRASETYADCLFVLRLDLKSGFKEIYAGRFPGHLLQGKKPSNTGYYRLSLSALENENVHTFIQRTSMNEINEQFRQVRNG